MKLSALQKLGMVWAVADCVTDALFTWHISEEYFYLACVAGVSLVFSTGALLTMYFLDASIFFSNPKKKRERRILKLRWKIFILVPLEDLVMLNLGIYINFWVGDYTFLTYMCMVVSVASIIFLHGCNLIMEKRGINNVISGSRASIPRSESDTPTVTQPDPQTRPSIYTPGPPTTITIDTPPPYQTSPAISDAMTPSVFSDSDDGLVLPDEIFSRENKLYNASP